MSSFIWNILRDNYGTASATATATATAAASKYWNTRTETTSEVPILLFIYSMYCIV